MDKLWFNDIDEFVHVAVGIGYSGTLDLEEDVNID